MVAAILARLVHGAAADTFYVSHQGSDSGDGSLAQPWRTVLHAGSTAGPGDVVLVRGGVYDEGEIWIRKVLGHGGAPGQLLTIKNYPGETPQFVNGDRPFIVDADFVRVEGLHFTNGKSLGTGGLAHNAPPRNTVEFVNNTFTGSGYAYDAIGTTGNNVLIEGNVCNIQGNTQGTQGHCFYISHGTNITIRNNVVSGMTGYGIHVFDQRRSEDPPEFERLIKNVVIEGNRAYGSEQRAGIIVAAYDHSRLEDIVIRNNLVYDNATVGIALRSDASNVAVDNNTIYNNRDGAIDLGGSDTITNLTIRNNIFDLGSFTDEPHIRGDLSVIPNPQFANNLYWPGPPRLINAPDATARVGDPLFLDAAARDFRLRQGSAALDVGSTLLGVTRDFFGVARPQGTGYDVGAIEGVAPPGLPADFNKNGTVNGADLALWIANCGLTRGSLPAQGDANVDGAVNATDFLAWQRQLGGAAPVAAQASGHSVPEPSIGVVGLGASVSLAYRRRGAKGRMRRRYLAASPWPVA